VLLGKGLNLTYTFRAGDWAGGSYDGKVRQ
jgi:hypothetical protein